MSDLFFSLLHHGLIFAQRGARGVPKKSAATIDMSSVVMIILGVAAIAAIVTVAYYVISNLRKGIKESEEPPSMSDHLTTFQEAKDEGNMTPMEYNKVRDHLSKKIVREVKRIDVQEEPEDDSPKFIAK